MCISLLLLCAQAPSHFLLMFTFAPFSMQVMSSAKLLMGGGLLRHPLDGLEGATAVLQAEVGHLALRLFSQINVVSLHYYDLIAAFDHVS